MKKVAMSLCFVFALAQVFGQLTTNKTKLNSLSEEKAIEFKAKKTEAIDYAKRHDIPIIIKSEEGIKELMHVDTYGKPQYYKTFNVNAAATVSTNKVNSGGGYGYSLDGSGMTIHEWDGGGVLTSHQEYGGRVVQGDGVSSTHYHSTHVAGTLIASGVVSNAKGMAPAADLRAFDWNGDDYEMANEASNANTLVSNHSYGYVRGWDYDGTWTWHGNASISTQEDYLFGFYDSQAQSWDNIAYNAPFYLIVRSAGNDRGDGPSSGAYPQDGPYDCISHAGVAKNILTVGSVADIAGGYTQPSDVIMSSYSSWGPADDGRIKPDIVANGSGLYSTDNGHDADYTTLSGTSMASPNAAGSMILLQEHYEDLNGSGNYMRAATLKALVIHTADEAGDSPGPDYEFGWGLLNTKAAADLISDDPSLNTLEEITLANTASFQRTVKALGGEPLKVTIAWTDVPGSPVTASLDPSDAMLVNDLDLRVTQSTNIYFPWKLDGANPSAAATRADENNVDNVEVVLIENPVAGLEYTIVVDHDGSLNGGLQAFSLVVSGIEDPDPIPPVADFAANNTSPFTGSVVCFTDQSANNPTTWSWSFSPSTVTFINGTDANSRNPQITFDVAGTYDVTLTSSNSYGSDTETKTAYISVSDPLPVTLPWVEDFENFGGFSYYSANTSAIDGLPGWSYEKTENGRLRFNAGSDFCYSGSHAATMDASPSGTISVNHLITTLNLSDYASSDMLELSFMYMHHGEEGHSNDRVWIRGSDNDPWIEAYDLYANKASAGVWKSVVQIDIDQLLANNGQVPGDNFQLRFGQEDDSPTLNTTASDGYTFDDITIAEMDANAYMINSFPYSQSWESGEGLWMQSGDDDFDWTWHSGTTISVTTGPSGAHDGTYYMYTESSSPRVSGDQAFIEAAFDFTTLQNPQLSFYYHMYGSTMGSLHVDIYDGTAWTNDVWMASGELQNAETDPFAQALVDLTAWGGQNNIMIRFRGSVGNGGGTVYYSDMAFDMIEVDGVAAPQPPVADFMADNTQVDAGDMVQFTDLSTGANSWSWTFDGGTPASSTDQHPGVTYDLPGTYTVELTVANAEGTDTETKIDYIIVNEILYPPVADFTADQTSITEGDQVQFTDLSTNATAWLWTFNGGTPSASTSQHPAVTYDTPGTYTVELTVTNADGTDTETKIDYITVNALLNPPVADFTADQTSIAEGDQVQFTDLSTDATAWSWTFSGGTPSASTAQHPEVTYDTPGTYTVELTVTNADGTDTETKIDYITVNALLNPPVADFTADQTSIAEGDQVQFTDLSTDATAWSWTFNGGTPSASTSQHPEVTYNTPGTYTVELTVTNADGSDIETKINYITVIEVLYPPVADFTANSTVVEEGETVQFNDQSSNNPTSWNWSFEGANINNSSVQHPSVTYNVAGNYSVTLLVSNPDGSDDEIKSGYITVNPALTSAELLFTDFESGWGLWTDGGNDCQLHTSGTYAWGGNNAANIQDDSGIPSSFFLTNGIDVHTPAYVQLDVEFYFVALGMKNQRDGFQVEYFDGNNWNTVASFACKNDFIVGNYYKAVVSIHESSYTFPTDMKIRFMNLARKDDKDLYVDDIKIIGYTQTVQSDNGLTLMNKSLPFVASENNGTENLEIDLYPNPTINNINIKSDFDGEMSVFIYNMAGQQMYYGEMLNNHEVINVRNFDNGLYVVRVLSGDQAVTKRFLKQ